MDERELVRQAFDETPEISGEVRTEDFTIVVCFEDEGRERFLMARHAKRGWELPGGTVRPGENPLVGAVREFGEETGHRLQGAEIALKLPTEHGTCWVVSGRWGPAVEGHEPHPEEQIEETRFVGALDEVAPLAWPEDPYDAIEAAIGVELR